MAEALSSALSSASSAISSATTAATRALASAPPPDQYLRWDAPGVESPTPNEDATAHEIAQVMNRMQRRNFDKHRKAFRATHVKTQGIVKGQLKVRGDLPQLLRQGIFGKPGATYDVVARYANEPIFLQEDQAPGPRGMAMKVFGVAGERLGGGSSEDKPDDSSTSTTQDFFFNNAPMLELTDINTTLDIMRLREKYFDNPTQLAIQTKLRTDAVKQSAPSMLPNTNMISHEMYTQSAFRFGEWYGHMGLFPAKQEMKDKSSENVTTSMPENQIKDWLFDYFAGSEAVYEFRVSPPFLITPSLFFHQNTLDSPITDPTSNIPHASPNRRRLGRLVRNHGTLANSGHSDVPAPRLL